MSKISRLIHPGFKKRIGKKHSCLHFSGSTYRNYQALAADLQELMDYLNDNDEHYVFSCGCNRKVLDIEFVYDRPSYRGEVLNPKRRKAFCKGKVLTEICFVLQGGYLAYFPNFKMMTHEELTEHYRQVIKGTLGKTVLWPYEYGYLAVDRLRQEGIKIFDDKGCLTGRAQAAYDTCFHRIP
jgi:hypothetical protein